MQNPIHYSISSLFSSEVVEIIDASTFFFHFSVIVVIFLIIVASATVLHVVQHYQEKNDARKDNVNLAGVTNQGADVPMSGEAPPPPTKRPPKQQGDAPKDCNVCTVCYNK